VLKQLQFEFREGLALGGGAQFRFESQWNLLLAEKLCFGKMCLVK